MEDHRDTTISDLLCENEFEAIERDLLPDRIACLMAELDTIERKLDRNYTYFLTVTRRRLKRRAGTLRAEISRQDEGTQRLIEPFSLHLTDFGG